MNTITNLENKLCQARHNSHDRLMVETAIGRMFVYNRDKYKDFPGYCTGQDDVSMTLINTGEWASHETEIIRKILKEGDRSAQVWDFGAHIGWYSVLAAKLGYQVISFEGDPENLDVLKINAALNGVSRRVKGELIWIDEKSAELPLLDGEVELLKADVEGSERYVIEMARKWLEARRVKNLFIEISPVFNDGYPALVKKITDYGYTAYRDGKEFDGVFDFNQADFLFVKK